MGAEVAELFTVLRAETAPFTRGLKTAAVEGESFIAKMGGLKAGMVKLGAATTLVGVAFVAYGVKAAGDFQQSMNLLVTACGESQANIKGVSDGILSLARQTGTSTSMLADGMYQVEKAGYRGADGLKVLKAASQGAREEGANLKDVTNAMTSVMASYHLKATDSVRVMNALKTAAGEGKMTMEEFSGALSTVIPIASANKIGIDQVGGAIATLTQHGTSAREATQELASTIRSLAAPNNVAVQEMQRLGLSSVDVSTNLGKRGLTGTMDLLSQTVLSKMGPSGTLLLSTFNQTKQAAADADQMVKSMPASLQTLAQSYAKGSISLGDWRKELKTLPPEQANLLAQYATLQNKTNGFSAELKKGGPAAQTYTEAIKKMTGGAIGLNTTLQLTGENTEGFKDRVAKVGASFAHAGKDVEGWDVTQKSFNVQMGRLKEALVTTAIVIGMKLIPVILSVITFFEKHKNAAKALAFVIGTVLVIAVAAFTVALWNMAAAAMANPLTWVVVAVVAIIVELVLLVVYWREIWNFIKTITLEVVGWLVTAWHWMSDQTSSIWGAIVDWLKGAWRSVAAFFSSAWHMVADPIVSAWHWVADTTSMIWGGISAFFRKWWPLLLVIFSLPIATLLATWNHFHTQITDTVKTVWGWIATFLKGTWMLIVAAAKSVWGAIQAAIVQPIAAAWSWLAGLWRSATAWLGNQWRSIRGQAASIWSSIRDSMTGPISSAWRTISSTLDSIKRTISDKLHGAWNSVKDIGNLFQSIGSAIVHGIISGVTGAAGSLYDSLRGLANGALSAAKNFIESKSPSKLFAREVGQWIPHGIAAGVDEHAHVATDAVTAMTSKLGANRLAFGGGSAIPSGAMASGGGGGTVVTNVNVTVQGHVLTERNLRDMFQQEMLKLGARNPQTYQPYQR